ncbi:DUF971 domain-containing protein [Novipirellula artificiosorum]|uniref:Gamma-butyrobetaine hydroxylase-like N-terminal domain-containing protein n=1 Tax=Novipirellula artificiosorum TaxID=2528016 RepID=A0A5C6DGX2_9BACT|nr:DUF971 domain-containing protein [Novipirellula artificiosorum]TWU34249.1 hypothetical protein Poly41_43950 [Novipirellula artificiosorum]
MQSSESKENPDAFDLSPTAITRDGDATIEITWTDGSTNRWTAGELRKACPCATCREKRKASDEKKATPGPTPLPVLSSAEARPLQIESMRPVGSYAYNIAFSDGHSSGIFPMRLLAGQKIEME